jgi:ribonucleotide reductase beta subunit family protein with ferritin-like domain
VVIPPELSAAKAIDKVSYEDLYERWEKANWRSSEIDFSEDRKDWHEGFTNLERRAALWNYSMFFHGEDSVADNLSPYIDAAPTEEQKYFLATQQVDEARHAVFFGRFMREVVERGSDIASSLEATRSELSWGFRQTFRRLDRMADELRRDRSKPKFAQAITLYHVVVEAALAQPGQHFIESYLEKRDMLPGFRAGMRNISQDEQRHIGFGVKTLSELVEEDPECKDAVAELLREVMPYTAAVFVPPGWDERYVTEFGFTLEEIYAEGFQSFETKLRTAGLPLEELTGVLPLPLELTPGERAARAITMLRAGLLGEGNGRVERDTETMALHFDTICRSVETDAANGGPFTLQWDFSDADPWFVRVDDGDTHAEQGRAPSPDVTLSCRFDDWVDLTAGRADPRRLLLRRKIRPKGSPLALWRARKVLPG